jgi:hypothetical protein
MQVMERGTNTMKMASRIWGIPLFFLGNHLNDSIKSKRIRFGGVLIDEENVAIVRWVLSQPYFGEVGG